jgi:hypothetical protein
MTEPRDERQPGRELTPADRSEAAEVIGAWARELPPHTSLLEFLDGGRTARAQDVARAMDHIAGRLPAPDTATRDLGEHIMDVVAVNAREFGLSNLLRRFNAPGPEPTASAGPSHVTV